MVTMFFAKLRLMWSTIAASVVDFPEPVVPVTTMIPRGSPASRVTTSGSPSSAAVRISKGTTRQAIEIEPRWRNAFTRKRASPRTVYEKSISPSRANSASRSLAVSISRSTRSVSAGLRGSDPSIGVRSPCSRISGCDGTFR